MTTRAPARLGVLALLALLAPGCILVRHRCPVPAPEVEAVPAGARIPLAVAVAVTARRSPAEVFSETRPAEAFGFDPVPPSAAMLERIAASAFDRVVPAEGGAAPPASVVLELRVEGARLETPTFGPYGAAVSYRATLRTPDGAVVATAELAGAGSSALPVQPSPQCPCVGDAAVLAIEEAGTKLVRWLGSDPAFAAWLAARGLPAPALGVRPAALRSR